MAKRNNGKRSHSRVAQNTESKKKRAPRGKDSRSYRKDDFDDNTRGHYSNDPAWYAMSPQMLIDAASINYSNALGSTDWPHFGEQYEYDTKEAFPGIMAIKTVALPGVSKDNSSPVNVAARNIYSFVRHKNSGHSNYDSPDLMMYILAMDSLYSMWAWLVRAYGVMHSYAVYNKYYAEAIFSSMGLDWNDFQYRAADFRTFINMFAHKLSKVCCPTSLSFITRHVWMYSHLWVDSPSKKAQTYLYVPEAFWVFDETNSITQRGALVYHELSAGMAFDEVVDMCNTALARIIESEDMMIMSGDILKAFGEDHIMALGTIPEDFMVVPACDPAVCSQIQNCFLVGQVNQFVITQNDDNAIICEPILNGSHFVPGYLHLNLRVDSPTPADTMVATRLMPYVVKGEERNQILSCGSDIATAAWIYRYVQRGGKWTLIQDSCYSMLDVDAEDPDSAVRTLIDMEKFDWHPTQYVVSTNGLELGISGDVDNYTTISKRTLEDMHNLALISQFGCPSMGPFAIK
uniref:Capsid protein n=1 Tax=Dromedary picobirnavirus TaxID=1574421 RepID=A0A0A1EJA1_9VIRU|nr:capsid protein [Dromedary picobirnavirus]